MTIQGFSAGQIRRICLQRAGEQVKSDQLLKTESGDCANEVKKLSCDKVRELEELSVQTRQRFDRVGRLVSNDRVEIS